MGLDMGLTHCYKKLISLFYTTYRKPWHSMQYQKDVFQASMKIG